jgi:hypothetical protein
MHAAKAARGEGRAALLLLACVLALACRGTDHLR